MVMLKVVNLKVNSPIREYKIKIGRDILGAFPQDLAEMKRGSQVLLVSNSLVYDYYGRVIKDSLTKLGYQVLVSLLPDGEEYKTWGQVEDILTTMLEAGFNRDALVIALGGGVIGDLGGFAASIYQRGIDLIQLPTTLLAQVDSSIGGKVAVNHPLGKNMIGAFYQPVGVWTDVKTLLTLPDREWKGGLAEVIKYGVIWDEDFFSFIEKNISQIKKRDMNLAQELVFRSCQIKGMIVAQDERDEGLRTILNFGHTIGHALEKITKYQVYRHGEGVAIGMVMAAKIGIYLKMCTSEVEERLKFTLIELGLPVSMPNVNLKEMVKSLYLDKKVKNKELVFVLPRKIGEVEIVKGIRPQEIINCLQEGGWSR